MADLVAAGAPELPEGYFYRVRETSIDSLKVEIRQQRKRFGSRLIRETYVLHERYDTAPEAVVDACRRVHENWGLADAERAAYRAATAFLGDHDPKGGR
ncbi:hypothetical protein [Streptomyces umbrinus]|uniref:hypothetical protein n=1 Tax=Streptomyces umbrinus TaxID=67370 RepID=UPI0034403AF9